MMAAGPFGEVTCGSSASLRECGTIAHTRVDVGNIPTYIHPRVHARIDNAHAHAAATGRETWAEAGCRERGDPQSRFDFRQLRHHTKTVLQQILLPADAEGLRTTVCSSWLLAGLQRRIRLSAEISDALFGLPVPPAPMAEQLRMLTESMIRMLADGTQMIRPEVTVAGKCPEPLHQLVLRVAQEFVGNDVRHGMRARLTGMIIVHLATDVDGSTTLVVTDDGWGFDSSQNAGDGLKIANDLAAAVGGTASLLRTHGTVASLELPAPLAKRGFGHRNAGSGCGITGREVEMKSSIMTALLVGLALVLSGCIVAPGPGGWCYYLHYRCSR
jgi:two-component sensor histidine kinase